jgi:hypothetical protein
MSSEGQDQSRDSLRLVEIVGSGLCVASDDGLKVYTLIKERLDAGTPTVLSFAGVEVLTSAFLNAAIGQLYGTLHEEHIRRLLSPARLGYR